MKTFPADKFFDDIDFISITNTIKGIFISDGSMATLLDFERVLDNSDLYAFKNWIYGELVKGPVIKRYTISCTFMYPYHLMPNPAGAKRLLNLGCKIRFKKTKLKVPIEVKDYDDFVPGTRYPKMVERTVWLVQIEMRKELIKNVEESYMSLADETIDLEEIEQAYDKQDIEEKTAAENQGAAPGGMAPPAMGAAPPMPGLLGV